MGDDEVCGVVSFFAAAKKRFLRDEPVRYC
jgi:hypothetical protein